jgi:hypothetical protein
VGAAGTTFLNTLQLAVSAGVLVLLWLIYPGPLAGVVGLGYVGASIAAARGRPALVWLAFGCSVLAAAGSAWGVYRYLVNGFDYLSGNFPGRAGIAWPAYLFLIVAAGSIAVVVLHIGAWRGAVRPRERRPR